MPGDPGGVHRGTSGLPHPLRIQGQVLDGGSRGGIIQGGITRFSGGNPRGPAAPHRFKCGGGRSGASLYLIGGSRRRRSGRVGKGGDTPCQIFLCR